MHFRYQLIHLFNQQFWELSQTPPELLELLQKTPKGSAIDIGCGIGKHARHIAQSGWHVTGIDFSSMAIQKAQKAAKQQHLENNTTFIEHDITKLPSANLPQFDIGYDLGCFYFKTEQAQLDCVAGIASVIKPNAPFLLLEFLPHWRKHHFRADVFVGTSPERIHQIFSHFFEIHQQQEAHTWRYPAQYYWMTRKA
jgi:ubiquinone/menaquinone biosynthesis C-methylase UbiE